MWDALDDTLEDAKGHEQAGGDAGQHCITHNRYVKTSEPDAREQLASQIYYFTAIDPRDPPDREARQLFTDDHTDIARKEARRMIWNNRSTRGAVCFHRLILSPSTGLGITTRAEAQEWTRTVMRDLGARVDRDLTWVAGCHTNRSHTHVHILIAGEAAQLSKGGARRVVRFGRDDIKALRTRITIEAARPIREATQARRFEDMRARQAARNAELDRRLGVRNLTPAAPIDTPAQVVPPAPQAARKRRWWQRGA